MIIIIISDPRHNVFASIHLSVMISHKFSVVQNSISVFRCHTTPKSCKDILKINPAFQDGNYTINRDGTAIEIYCHNMTSGHPKEYINLVEKNFFYRAKTRQSVVWYNKTTYYTKMAVNIQVSIISTRIVMKI